MSILLEDLVRRRKQTDIEYQQYIDEIIALSKKVKDPSESDQYPSAINTRGKQAIYDNVGKDKTQALILHDAIMNSRSDDWRQYYLKEKRVKKAIDKAMGHLTNEETKKLLEIIKNQREY